MRGADDDPANGVDPLHFSPCLASSPVAGWQLRTLHPVMTIERAIGHGRTGLTRPHQVQTAQTGMISVATVNPARVEATEVDL